MGQTFPLPITEAMVTPAHVPVITYINGAPNEGADADNDGETGTANSTGPAYAPLSQSAKAAQLGTTMAVDVTKSYGAKDRGEIEPFQPYPVYVEPAP